MNSVPPCGMAGAVLQSLRRRARVTFAFRVLPGAAAGNDTPMLISLASRILCGSDPRCLWRFLHSFGWKGMLAVRRFTARRSRGVLFPAFHFISVTNRCNLRCKGCWMVGSRESCDMEPARLRRIIDECRAQGSFFFGILGGEPLMYPGLLAVFAEYPDCYFLLFTTGTRLDARVARRLRRLGNVTPLVSVEGLEEESDARRGGRGVYARSMEGLAACRRQRLITGVATSVCRTNFEELVSERFVKKLVDLGVAYLWYYIYRPVGPDPSPELALDSEEILRLRRFIVDIRCRAPIMVVDAYWDHEGRALCPAGVGIAHHVGPGGALEPCPPIQFAREEAGGAKPLDEVYAGGGFLAKFRECVCAITRGCIIMEHPEVLADLVAREGAADTSGRGTGHAELAGMSCCASHHLPGREIPEKHWAYRLAKKYWFFGFGAYG